jgi:hypothetical protein
MPMCPASLCPCTTPMSLFLSPESTISWRTILGPPSECHSPTSTPLSIVNFSRRPRPVSLDALSPSPSRVPHSCYLSQGDLFGRLLSDGSRQRIPDHQGFLQSSPANSGSRSSSSSTSSRLSHCSGIPGQPSRMPMNAFSGSGYAITELPTRASLSSLNARCCSGSQ